MTMESNDIMPAHTPKIVIILHGLIKKFMKFKYMQPWQIVNSCHPLVVHELVDGLITNCTFCFLLSLR